MAKRIIFYLVFAIILGYAVEATAALEGNQIESIPAKQDSTEWNWPLPYTQVSKESLEWLKSKGWLPLTIGYFADLPGYSACYAIIKELKLLEKRGITVKFISFLSGPTIVEAFLSGQTQVTHYGDFPFWLTVDKGAPVKAYALTGVNNEIAMLVKPRSSIQSPEDLKQKDKQAVIGTTLGSYAEFYLTAMIEHKGLVRGQDFKVAGLSMRDAQLLPKGVDAVVLWDPHITFSEQKKLGRKIDTGYPYFFNTGFDFIREEIHENAPDVVQALADVAVEALLFTRYNPDAAVDFYRKDSRIAAYPRELIKEQIVRYLTFYPPTFRYIHEDFWAAEDSRIIKVLRDQGRVVNDWNVPKMKDIMESEYMANTFHKLGWQVPEQPVFLPEGWDGKVANPPYPEYLVPGGVENSGE